MPEAILGNIEFTGYISIVKLVIFLVLFFPWIKLFGWVYDDAKTIGTNETLWAGVVLAAGAFGALLWLLIPMPFIVGMLLYIICVAAALLIYIMDRNALVSEYDKILTPEHIKGFFANHEKQMSDLEDMGFISANDNEIPVPEPRSSEFSGFKVAYDLFKDVLYRRATNLVMMPRQQHYSVSYVVDGATLSQADIPRERAEKMLDFLKQLASLEIDEKRKPQKGNFRLKQDKGSSQWELRTAGSTAGEQIKIKLVTQDTAMRLSEINLTAQQYEQLNAFGDMNSGLFLISGTPQSGVSTTFYAMIRQHDAFINSISTLEYNPTTELPNVTQELFSLSDSSTTTYAEKLMGIIRMAPNVLGVVDVKDAETARAACLAVKEGAIVYATVEADSVSSAVGKFIRLVGDKRQVVEAMVGASNQRLFRKLCPECKQAYEANKDLLRKFNIPPGKIKALYRAGKVHVDKRGKATPCETCHEIGFFGRTCVFETIMLNNELKKGILQAKSIQDIATQFRKSKMKFLQEQMLEKVLDGTTSINELIRIFSGSSPKSSKRKK